MKKCFAIVMALCLMLLAAQAEGVQEGIDLRIGERDLSLAFDPSIEYSGVSNGSVQASFYAYTDNSDELYELTLNFPESVHAGDVVDFQYALSAGAECSVVLIYSTSRDVGYYMAGVSEGVAFPQGSRFEMRFEDVTDADGGTRYTGRLSATLTGMNLDSDFEMQNIDISDAPFSFTMPDANRGLPGETPAGTPDPEDDGYNPFDPEPTPGTGYEDPFGAEPTLEPTPAPSPTRDLVKV